MDDSRVKDAAALISLFFDQKKIAEGQRYASFVSDWQNIVGERLASHSWVADADKGVLLVEAEHPGWIQLLQLKQNDILQRTARAYPELQLKAVAFRLGKRSAAATRSGAGRTASGGTADAKAAGSRETVPGTILDSTVKRERPVMPGPFGPQGRPTAADTAAEKLYQGKERADSPEEREKKESEALESIKDPVLRGLLCNLKKAIDEDAAREEAAKDPPPLTKR